MPRADFDEPVQRRKLSDEVAKRLEAEILAGKYPVGAKLPPEKDLAQVFGIGRSSMREAVRTLEAAGYLRSAHGVGVFVVSDRSSSIAPIDQALMGGFTMSDLFEARVAIEGKAAELAAVRLTDHHRERISAIIQAAGDPDISDEEFVRLDASFHREVAAASGNPLLLHMWDSLAPQFEEYSSRVIGIPGRLRHAHDDHRRIALAILAGDGEQASSLAVEHVNAVQQELQDGVPH